MKGGLFLRLALAVVMVAMMAMAQGQETDYLTTNAGAPVDNLRASETVGPRGATLLQDFWLLENLQIHNRERIPERVVHARGATAKGVFVVTNNLTDLTIADFVQAEGNTTPVAIRFSTVVHGIHSPEFLRDPRGFAVKLYTQQGNYDIVGNNWPVFFIRDGLRFPEMVRAFKPNPKTGVQEWWRILDFFANYPEAMHALTWLLDDIGIPLSYRYMHGWGIHTYKLINKAGVETLIRWHFRSRLGEKGQLDEDAVRQPFSFHTTDLLDAIARGEFPRYDVLVQTMSPNALPSTFDPLDPTKEWPVAQYPYRKVGEITLNQNVDSFFTESEQIAFAPSRMVPGVAPSDDKLLQARLFAYADTQRYRLGVNNQMLPINAPKCPFKDNHVDGAMHFRTGSKASREVNYFPSTIDRTREAPAYPHEAVILQGKKERTNAPVYDDFIQAGDRWRSFDAGRQQRFADRAALTLSGSRITASLREVWLGYWSKVDPRLAEMIQNSLTILATSAEKTLETREARATLTRLNLLKESFIRSSGYL